MPVRLVGKPRVVLHVLAIDSISALRPRAEVDDAATLGTEGPARIVGPEGFGLANRALDVSCHLIPGGVVGGCIAAVRRDPVL